MARQVTWTESAWTDIEEVADYIAKDSQHYAGAFIREFVMRQDHWLISRNEAGQCPNLMIRLSVNLS